MTYQAELIFARKLTYKAGGIIQKHYRKVSSFKLKADETPVTIVDTAINDLVLKNVRMKFPDDEFDGEEGGSGFARPRKWVCDPIDGTQTFNIGLAESTFMLGLYEGEQPVMAVVYNPILGEFYEASLGNGAFCNGKRIRVSSLAAKDRAYLVVDPKLFREMPEVAPKLEKAGFQLVGVAATGQKMIIVANGRAAGMVRGTGDYHDVSIGSFLIQEAGGTVTDLSGTKPAIQLIDGELALPNGYIAASPEVHAEILSALSTWAIHRND